MPSAKSVALSQTFEVECSLVYSAPAATDFVFLVHALDAMDHTVLNEEFTVSEGLGSARVQAIADWIYDKVDHRIGSTQSTTSAADVFLSRAHVCRNFAPLGVSDCRALNIPARLVAGYAIFEQPPPDFHAVFEAYPVKRCVMFEPPRMSPHEHFVRIASGPDAKDVAFATLFGPVTMLSMSPQIRLVD
jgi:Transglutaminase-like superfamily